MNLTKEKRATFTPGPWEVYSCEEGERHGQVFAPDGISDGKTVCDLPKSKLIQPEDKRKNHYFVHSAEDEANARLIAAAPEMYEMCKLLEECMENIDGRDGWDASYELAKIREVLAKVEGGEG
jgi:hypothetical protein